MLAGMKGKVALATASLVATVIAAETAFRTVAAFENRGLLSALRQPWDVPVWSLVTLGQMIRRSANPRIIYELRPDLRVVYEGGRVTTTRAGYRQTAPPPAGEGTPRRILGIGDSYMFGQGVSDEETYLARLAVLLNAPSPGAWDVTNAAVPGYNTVMEVAALEEKGLALRPDLVVIEVVGNDFDLPNFIQVPQDPMSWRKSFLADFVARRLRRVAQSQPSGLTPAPQEPIPGGAHFLDDMTRVPPEYRDMVGIEAWEGAMQRLADVCSAAGVPVVVMTQGVSFDRRLWRVSNRLGFHYLDLAPALRRFLKQEGYAQYSESPLALRRGDAHPSALAHRLIAAELFAFLKDHQLPTPRRSTSQAP
jgi:lysophospholipase L1-like esterase